VTVVRISPGHLEELATSGNRQLGGRDWDQALIDYVVADFREKHGIDLATAPQAMQDLLLECERAKRRLGRLNKTAVRVHAQGREHQVEIRREQFEDLTAHLLQTTKLTTEVAVRDTGLKWQDISRVVLVGGSTHMPAVRQMLEELSGKRPETGVNPGIAVAVGAAIYAHMLETGQAAQPKGPTGPAAAQSKQPARKVKEPWSPTPPSLPPPVPAAALPTVRFVTAHGVGLKVRGRQGWINKVLIPKNTPVPASVTKRFLTGSSAEGKKHIRIEITQGDTKDLAVAERLGTGHIQGLSPSEPDNQPVDVTMRFDEQGRLTIAAIYVPRRQQMDMTLEIPGGLREEEVREHRRHLAQTGFFA
jgi:molecular chaperone DnaK